MRHQHGHNCQRKIGAMLTALAASVVSSLAALALVGAPVAAVADEGCSNEARRVEQRATFLPDCRAYEVVSPQGSSPAQESQGYEASLGGERFAWHIDSASYSGVQRAGQYFLSSRGADGWSTQGMIPSQSTESGICQEGGAYIAFWSPDLSQSILGDGWNWTGYPRQPDDGGTVNCGHDEPLLVPGEPEGAQNLFLHDSEAPVEAGFYRLLDPSAGGVARDAWPIAASSDFSHIVFASPLQLTPEAPAPPEANGSEVREDVYENVGGALHFVTILPGGTPTWGLLANYWVPVTFANASFTNAVSSDGERAFFYAGGALTGLSYAGGNLYMRENVAQPRGEECAGPTMACTIQLDLPQAGAPPGPGGDGRFQWASTDGSKAFFTDCSRLTEDSTAVSTGGCGGFAEEKGFRPPTGNDLYEYDLSKPLGERLTDLSIDHEGSDALGADVQGVAGVSGDGAYVYFVADGALTGGQENGHHERAQTGQPNLYLSHGGATTYIATLDAPEYEASQTGKQCDWASYTPLEGREEAPRFFCSRSTSDGGFLAFNSRRSLTGYDNVVEGAGRHANEIFLYDAATNNLNCVSCDPQGRAPTARAEFEDPHIEEPMVPEVINHGQPAYLTRYVTEDGRVFFDTTNALLPTDENTTYDVYEWEPVGVGSCVEASSAFVSLDGGCLYLISSGASGNRSEFKDASASGNDVFFTTAQALVSSDADNAVSIYDASVGGGFVTGPVTGPGGVVEAPACTSAEACKPPASEAPPEPFPASSAFNGAGNLVVPLVPPPVEEHAKKPSCKKGFQRVKVGGRSVCKRVPVRHRRKRSVSKKGGRK